MFSVELRVDIGGADGIPHSFIVVVGADGVEHGYGFAPLESGTLMGAGKIYDDTYHEYTSTTGKIPLLESDYIRLMEYIRRTELNPPDYYLPFGSQCANWAVNALTEAGIEGLASPNMVPDYFLRDLFETIVWNPYTQWINIEVNDFYLNARRWALSRDPLVLDLDGDGIETTGITGNSPTLFDHDADGTRTGTGWIKPDDGLVVLDRNGNGLIDSGRELFGDETLLPNGSKAPDGYAALAQHDANGDGRISSADAVYSQLRIWQDANQDGISQAGELRTLADLGIASIGLQGTQANVDLGNGNSMPLQGTFTRMNGSTGMSGVAQLSGSLLLASNGFYREFSDDPVPTEAAKALPQMRGAGWARDLREAMSVMGGEGLQMQVQAFAAATTRDGQLAGLDELLTEWAKSSGRMLNEVWNYDLRQDDNGNYTTGIVGGMPSPRRTVLTLNPEGMVQPVEGGSGGSAGSSGGNGGGSGASSGSERQLTPEGRQLLKRLNVLEVFNGLRFLQIEPRESDGLPQGAPGMGSGGGGGSGGVDDGITRMVATLRTPQIDLLNQSYEQLRESVYAALVVQTRLKPYLDSIALVIDESGIRFDTTQLEALLNQAQVQNARNGTIDLIELNKYSQPILQMVGFDGLARLRQTLGTLSADDRQAFGIFLSGTVGTAGVDIYLGDGGDNSFNGKAGDDLMDGGGGKDLLDGGAGDDVLFGRDGNDTLYGGDGNDILNGGAGNDTLHGGTGNNTYLFGKGDGQDVIQFVHDPAAGKLNTLRFKEGVLSSEVALRQVYDSELGGNALEVSIAGTTDKVTINGFFYGNNPAAAYNPVQHFQFADGTAWNMAAILERLFAGTPGADTINGTLNGDAIHGGAGNDTLNGLAGDDTLNGDGGNDILSGGDGNDILNGGAGNDTLHGGTGNNTYLFGKGDGQDVIQFVHDPAAGKLNTLRFKEGVLSSEVALRQVYDSELGGNALEVSIAGTTDKVTINGFFYGNNPAAAYNPVQHFQFADGTAWNMAAILERLFAGTPGADTINGTLNGDAIHGGAGNDTLDGGEGDDTLDGGAGNDVLNGGAGNDTYLFGLGAGADTVTEYGTTAGNIDVMAVGEGVAADQLWFRRVGTNLEVTIIGTSDKSTINNWYSGSAYHIEQFRTADGKVLLDSQVDVLVSAMAAFSPPPAGQTTLAPDYQTALAPVLAASWN
jgi:Ca2+-binding RTX toxin-like protein